MQVVSPKPGMEEGGASKLWRSRSLPANSRDFCATSPSITRASSLKAAGQSSSTRGGLFSAAKATRPSALLERRRKVNPALKVEAFNNSEPPAAAASSPRSPYEVLQVSPLASQEDIKTAYRQSVLKHHPDKVPSHHREAATLTFHEIKSAYSLLKDPIARKRFDLQMSLLSFRSSGYQRPSPASTPSYSPFTTATSYRYTPRSPSYSSPSPSVYTPRAYPSTPSSPNLHTPRGSSSNFYTPRSPYSIGRNWETDQCV